MRHLTHAPQQSYFSAKSLTGLGLVGAATAFAAYQGRKSSPSPEHPLTKLWWKLQRKPAITPPGKAFATVWPVLWTLGAASAWRVWNAPASPARTQALTAWTAQIGLNAVWPALFFGKKEQGLAFAAIGTNLAAATAYVALASKVDGPAALMAAPMPLWLGYASYLNGAVLYRN